jgi:hypothetical protein
MSLIVGPDGHEVSSQAKPIDYEVGGIRIGVAETPESMLQKSLAGAQQLIAQQAYQSTLEKTGSAIVAQTEAQSMASKVANPFHIEPAALAVFMLMAREIEHRDRVIAALASRLDALDGKLSEGLLRKSWIQEPEKNKVESE